MACNICLWTSRSLLSIIVNRSSWLFSRLAPPPPLFDALGDVLALSHLFRSLNSLLCAYLSKIGNIKSAQAVILSSHIDSQVLSICIQISSLLLHQLVAPHFSLIHQHQSSILIHHQSSHLYPLPYDTSQQPRDVDIQRTRSPPPEFVPFVCVHPLSSQL